MATRNEKLSAYVGDLTRLSLEIIALKKMIAKLLPTGTAVTFYTGTKRQGGAQILVQGSGMVAGSPVLTFSVSNPDQMQVGIPIRKAAGQAVTLMVPLADIHEVLGKAQIDA